MSSTQVLGGAAIDRESDASFINVEPSRRVGDRWTVDLEFRGFVNVPPDDLFLYGIRKDDYLQTSWTWHWSASGTLNYQPFLNDDNARRWHGARPGDMMRHLVSRLPFEVTP